MAPAMRALPFNVCNSRSNSFAKAPSAGSARQRRKPAPMRGTRSCASSRNTGTGRDHNAFPPGLNLETKGEP
jgi:hypothetical protein